MADPGFEPDRSTPEHFPLDPALGLFGEGAPLTLPVPTAQATLTLARWLRCSDGWKWYLNLCA